MKTRKFLVPSLLSLIIVCPMSGFAPPRLQAQSADVDGCAVLAGLVYAGIVDNGMRGPSAGGGGVLYPMAPEITVCNQTARATTAAFSRAMTRMNIHVSWRSPRGGNISFCDSRYLSRCYPDRNPAVPFGSHSDALFVRDAWRSVRAAVARTMPLGSNSDLSRFDPAAMKRSLRASLDRGSRYQQARGCCL